MSGSDLLAFMSFGVGEMLVVAVVALLVFGGRLPEVMHSLGKAYAKFRRSMNEMTHPIRQEMRNLDIRAATRRPPAPKKKTEEALPAPADEPPPYTTPDESVPLTRGEDEIRPAPQSGAEPAGHDVTSGGGAADEPPPV